MQFEEFLNWHIQILNNYVKKGYLCCDLEIPSDAELCKQVFLTQLKLIESNKMTLLKMTFSSSKNVLGAFMMPHPQRIGKGKKKAKEDGKAQKGTHSKNQDNHSRWSDCQER